MILTLGTFLKEKNIVLYIVDFIYNNFENFAYRYYLKSVHIVPYKKVISTFNIAWMIEIKEPSIFTLSITILTDFDVDAFGQQAMKCLVIAEHIWGC